MELFGTPLSDFQLRDLERRWINRAWAEKARLRSVTHEEGIQMVGGRPNQGDFSGMSISYLFPGNDHPVTYRLRRNNPEHDSKGKQKNKYMSPPGDRNHIYVPPRYTVEHLMDATLPAMIVEGEFKGIAMARLAWEGVEKPRFLVIAVSGIYNWRGVIGAENNSNGVRVPVKGVIPEIDRINWIDRNVAILFDCDEKPNPEVKKARHFLGIELRTRGANVGQLEWPAAQGKGPDDRIVNVGPELMLADIARIEYNSAKGWEAKLLTTDTGKPKPLIENVSLALDHIPEFAGLAYDEFTERIVVPKIMPWPRRQKEWTDNDNTELARYMQRKRMDVSSNVVYEAVKASAIRNSFHPVRDYLRSLRWDGEPRIDQWLTTYCGVKTSNYVSLVGRCWLISAVARIFRPGCKADSALLLIGPEGKGKSTVCKILGGEWFSDNLPDLSDKDAAQHNAGRWIMELGELAALNRAAFTTVKAWMSRSEDIYRPAYGRVVVRRPRECVYIATSNDYMPLKDSTGNRRFWPVVCGEFALDMLTEDRDQVFAEAVAMFEDGVPWWLRSQSDIAAAEKEQTKRTEQHIWFDIIQHYCKDREMVTVEELLVEVLRKDIAHVTELDKRAVGQSLVALKWVSSQRRIPGKGRRKVYLNPEWIQIDGEDDED